jgi:hypothetical protein
MIMNRRHRVSNYNEQKTTVLMALEAREEASTCQGHRAVGFHCGRARELKRG